MVAVRGLIEKMSQEPGPGGLGRGGAAGIRGEERARERLGKHRACRL